MLCKLSVYFITEITIKVNLTSEQGKDEFRSQLTVHRCFLEKKRRFDERIHQENYEMVHYKRTSASRINQMMFVYLLMTV